MAHHTAFTEVTSSELPSEILLGTSSWSYPGWVGMIYHNSGSTEKELSREGLAEYSSSGLFRTVGIDSTFYGPPKGETLQHYASLLPTGFRWVAKVWEEITIPVYGNHPRYGLKAGKPNPHFLDPVLFCDRFLAPFAAADVRPHVGPFVFQFQELWGEMKREPRRFLDKLELFLDQLPADYQYAVEIRNSSFLSPDYFTVLNRHRVTHCFNHWTEMPSLVEQMKLAASAGGLTAPFFVSRILTPLGMKYEEARSKFRPYDRIQRENPQMRSDLVRLALRAVERRVPAFILVNNRAEGSAPLTIKAVTKMIVEKISNKGGD